MKQTTLSTILRLPAEILLVASLLASIYVKMSGNMQISLGAVALLLLINISYFIGRFLSKKNSFDF
jgi:membrane protein DedA with SNARE-associated domain